MEGWGGGGAQWGKTKNVVQLIFKYLNYFISKMLFQNVNAILEQNKVFAQNIPFCPNVGGEVRGEWRIETTTCKFGQGQRKKQW